MYGRWKRTERLIIVSGFVFTIIIVTIATLIASKG